MSRSISSHGLALTQAILFAALLCVATPPAIAQQSLPASSHGNPEAAKLKNPVAKTPESIAAGKRAFQRICVICHGPSGKGDGGSTGSGSQPADLTTGVWAHGGSDGEIFTDIHDGVAADMQGYSDVLSDADIWNLVNFIRSIGPQPKQPVPSQDSKQSKAPAPSK